MKFHSIKMYKNDDYDSMDRAFQRYLKYISKIEKEPELLKRIKNIHSFSFHDLQIVGVQISKNRQIKFQIKPGVSRGSPSAKLSTFIGKKRVIKIKNLVFFDGVLSTNVSLPLGANLIRKNIFIFIANVEVYYDTKRDLFRFRIIVTTAIKSLPEYFEVIIKFKYLKIEK